MMSVHNPRAAEHAHGDTSAWTALDIVRGVPDPEMPYLTLGDLGVVGEVTAESPDSIHVWLTPTYLGCPATEVIARDVASALRAAGWRQVAVDYRFDPPWTPDRITAEGRRKLAAEGVAPPTRGPDGAAPAPGAGAPVFVELSSASRVRCPRCGAEETRLLSAFGATPCQELRRCPSCGEPFPAIKAAR